MKRSLTDRISSSMEDLAAPVVGIVIMGSALLTYIHPWWWADAAKHASRSSYRGIVTEKMYHSKAEKYLVTTLMESGEKRVFENTDSWIEWKWNSGDVNANLEVGKKYDFKTYGWRWPFWSSYENIVGVHQVEEHKLESGGKSIISK